MRARATIYSSLSIFLVAVFIYGILLSPTMVSDVQAARISDIANTKHNFSAQFAPALPGGASRVVSATTENQICVFCHTPHGAAQTEGPLWNRQLSGAQYSTYSSGSLDSAVGPLQQPTGISKLCLSCHDGTMAIGAVNVLNGSFTDQQGSTAEINMQGTSAGGRIAEGAGKNTGFTRFIGTDLTNDHPISMSFDMNLFNADGEMRNPTSSQVIGVRTRGQKSPLVPLQDDSGGTSMVQCNTCHDPHIRDDTLNQNIKFLRLSRLQSIRPSNVSFQPGSPVGEANADIICLACHNKAGWVDSAHANPDVGDTIYTDAAADVREFPRGTRVWESACLACHDTHTVQGARRLTREGTDGPTVNVNGYNLRSGGRPAIEQTCYACHSNDGNTLNGQGAGFRVPNVKTDFTTLNTSMPITTDEQSNGANSPEEVHNIGDSPLNQAGKDFIESPQRLANRHVECTDCHNPHRVIKNRLFNANPANPGPAGTHPHTQAQLGGGGHTNIASGVLRGIWGVEPSYGSANFHATPNSNITFTVKRGNPNGLNPSNNVNSLYVTREYQVCLKCHSNYAYGNNPPMLGSFASGTPSGTNGMTQYTNQANEYNSPASHMGEGAAANGGAAGGFGANHRSWHPVIAATGRTPGVRNANANNWTSPFNLAVGTQTMYCTDCHGSDTNNGTAVPTGNAGGGGNGDDGRVWGPHGSENVFLLKGPWNGGQTSGTGINQPTHLCFKCHQYDQYANPAPATSNASGFSLGGGAGCMGDGGGGGGMGGGGGGGMMCMPNVVNLHNFHAGAVTNFRCNLCHVAVPHGWKNKVFLVNLNDVGPEGNLAVGTQTRWGSGAGSGYTNGPYYNRAALKVVNFATSGQWDPTFCGSSGAPGNGSNGVFWMAMSDEACINLP